MTTHSGDGGGIVLRRRRLARALALVSQGLEYHRGGRVEDYAPLYALAQRLLEASSTDGEDLGVPYPNRYCCFY